MPRTPRLDFPGARHHAMNRALRRDDLFLRDEDCVLFLDVLSEVPRRFGARIHGYALMPNHYHLLLEVPRGNLSAVMRHIGLVFTQAYNRAHGLDGPLFRGRFKNRLVQDDDYWAHLIAYLHLNPVRARLVKRPEDCLWTSHNAYIGELSRPDWLTTSEIIDFFGSQAALTEYIDGVWRKKRKPPSDFDAERLWSATSTSPVPEQTVPTFRTHEQALQDVAAIRGVDASEILSRPRGRRRNVDAWLATWWLLQATDTTQRALATELGITRPRVSQIAKRIQELAREDAEIDAQMRELEALL